jgi:hypothetical protein
MVPHFCPAFAGRSFLLACAVPTLTAFFLGNHPVVTVSTPANGSKLTFPIQLVGLGH